MPFLYPTVSVGFLREKIAIVKKKPCSISHLETF